VEFRILGPLEAHTDEGPVPLGGPRQRALLALLLLHANEPLQRDRLIDELWDGRPPDTAAKVLQNGVASLRKALARDRIVTHGSGYALRLEPGELDAWRFEQLVDESRRSFAAGDAAGAAATLREGEALWHGSALVDFAYDSFARSHSFRLEELRIAAIEDRIDAELALGQHVSLVPELTALVAGQPLRERLRSQLMLALYRSGRQVEALEVYRAGRSALVEELGIEPGQLLQQLERRILIQDPELDAQGPPAARATANRAANPVRKRLVALVVSIGVSAADGKVVDGELVGAMLARAVDNAARVLERHEAVVEQLTADAILGVFGLPDLHEDDALRAARAAVELREAFASQADEVAPLLAPAFGIDSAELVLHEPSGRPSLAAGQAVSGARALAEAAAPGEILAGGGAAALLRAAVKVDDLGTGRFRVVDVPVEAIAIPRRLDAPLVGRAEELEALHRAYARAVRERSCQLFTLLGGAGLGKTRLAAELRARVEPDALVLVGTCPPYGEVKTFLPLGEIVRQAVGGETRSALLSRLDGTHDAEVIAGRVAAALGWSKAPVPGPETFWAVRRLLETLAAERPLVVVFDDLHWAEPMFAELVEHIAELALGAPLLMLCLARPELLEERPGWGGGKLNSTTLLLEPLDSTDSARLIENLLGRARLGPEARASIAAAGEGNPLFIEQILSTLIDEGTLRREGGHWIATDDLSSRPLPPTLQALLAARLDRLGSEEHRAVQAAAVAGTEFTRESVVELTTLPDEHAEAALEALVRKDLVRPAPSLLPGEAGYRFRHVLIRDAAYDSLPKAARAELHARYGNRLERVLGDEPQDGLIGHHLAAAHDYRLELGQGGADLDDLAVRASARLGAAGRDAANREEAPAAVRLLRQAVDLRPDDAASAALLPLLSDVLNTTGRFGDSAEVVELALALALASGDEALEWDARLARLHLQIFGEAPPTTQEIRAEAARAIAALERLGDDRRLGRAWAIDAQAPWWEGRAAETADAARRSIAYATRAGDRRTAGRSTRTLLGTILFGPTPVAEGIEACRAILADAGDAPITAAAAMRAQAGLEAMAGNFAAARDLVERDRALVADLGARLLTFNVGQVAALVALLAGAAEDAVREARSAYEAAESLGIRSVRAEFGAVLAQGLALAGRYDEALIYAEQAEHIAEAEGDAVDHLRWRTAKAPLLARRGEHAEAERLAREAVEAAEATDFLWLHGDALVALSESLTIAGNREGEAVREAAIELYSRKGNIAAIEQARASH
jgi:DNA-binding SARP family transcriptional activator